MGCGLKSSGWDVSHFRYSSGIRYRNGIMNDNIYNLGSFKRCPPMNPKNPMHAKNSQLIFMADFHFQN